MTTYITYVTNFVQIREGHVETLVEVIWNDPYTECTCYQLILIAVLNMVYSTFSSMISRSTTLINLQVFPSFMAALNKSSTLIFYKIRLEETMDEQMVQDN